jgi:hypothetical protein
MEPLAVVNVTGVVDPDTAVIKNCVALATDST